MKPASRGTGRPQKLLDPKRKVGITPFFHTLRSLVNPIPDKKKGPFGPFPYKTSYVPFGWRYLMYVQPASYCAHSSGWNASSLSASPKKYPV